MTAVGTGTAPRLSTMDKLLWPSTLAFTAAGNNFGLAIPAHTSVDGESSHDRQA
ncbi:hypothetical protein ACFVYA_07495 [Amycolatopsis sp. NPDC058278]|uniref:hypothetical protein n=1 Tax=Amycolatopsis sp. NPDC058278 TaxID=3346417 RepID=UPI0036DC171C